MSKPLAFFILIGLFLWSCERQPPRPGPRGPPFFGDVTPTLQHNDIYQQDGGSRFSK